MTPGDFYRREFVYPHARGLPYFTGYCLFQFNVSSVTNGRGTTFLRRSGYSADLYLKDSVLPGGYRSFCGEEAIIQHPEYRKPGSRSWVSFTLGQLNEVAAQDVFTGDMRDYSLKTFFSGVAFALNVFKEVSKDPKFIQVAGMQPVAPT